MGGIGKEAGSKVPLSQALRLDELQDQEVAVWLLDTFAKSWENISTKETMKGALATKLKEQRHTLCLLKVNLWTESTPAIQLTHFFLDFSRQLTKEGSIWQAVGHVPTCKEEQLGVHFVSVGYQA